MSRAVVLPGRRKIEQLCGRCGITPNMLHSYLQDNNRTPAPWVAEEIARTLGRDVHDLFPTIERATQQPTDLHRRAEAVSRPHTPRGRSDYAAQSLDAHRLEISPPEAEKPQRRSSRGLA